MSRQWQSYCAAAHYGREVFAHRHAVVRCGSRRVRYSGRARQAVQAPGRWRQTPAILYARCRALQAAALLATGLSSAAAQGGMPVFPLQSSPQVYWSRPESAQVWGMPLHYVRFATQWPPERMAAELSRDEARFQVFTRLPGRLMLSGQASGQHWLAQLTPDGQGSRGLVSVWNTPAESAGLPGGKGVLAGMFQSSTLWRNLLHVRRQRDGRITEQAIYQGSAALPALLADVDRRLRQAGWEPEETSDSHEGRWRRAGQRLHWRRHSGAGPVMIFMHYSE